MIRKNLSTLLILISLIIFAFSVYAKYIKTEVRFTSPTSKNKVEMTLHESMQMVKSMEEIISVTGISGDDIKKSEQGYASIKFRSMVYFILILASIVLFNWTLQYKLAQKKPSEKMEGFEIL